MQCRYEKRCCCAEISASEPNLIKLAERIEVVESPNGRGNDVVKIDGRLVGWIESEYCDGDQRGDKHSWETLILENKVAEPREKIVIGDSLYDYKNLVLAAIFYARGMFQEGGSDE